MIGRNSGAIGERFGVMVCEGPCELFNFKLLPRVRVSGPNHRDRQKDSKILRGLYSKKDSQKVTNDCSKPQK